MKWSIYALLPILVLSLWSTAALAAETPEGRTLKRSTQPVVIAREGKLVVPITIAPDASDSVRQSAKLLQEYLQRITGAAPEIAAGKTPAGITLGTIAQFPDPALAGPLEIRKHYDGREAFVIRSEGGTVRLLANSDLGVQHAASRFLELLGCRWFFMTPTWHVVPKSPALEFAFNEDSRPDIWVRDIWFDRLAQKGEVGDVSAQDLFQRWAKLNRMAKSLQVSVSHAWQRVPGQVPELFKDHPEYFALVEGARTGPQFCVSNKGLQDAVIQYSKRELDTHPAMDMVSLDPADTSGWCTCPECAKLGHYSGQAFHLANVVARALRESHPGKYVGLLAYSWHSMPPPFDLEPNVHVQLTRGLNAGTYTPDELYDLWTKRTKGLGIYEYYSYWQMDRNMLPGTWITDLDANAVRIRDYVKRGVIDISGQSSNNWGIHGLAYYVANRLMWDASADVNALTQDFMAQAFGPAAAPMSRYYTRVSRASNPMPGLGLIRQAIDDVEEASRLAAGRPDVLARIDDIKRLLIYSYLGEKTGASAYSFVGIKMKEGIDWSKRREAFLDWFTWAYRIRNSHMIAWLSYRSTVGNPISKQFGEEWFWRNTIKSKAKNPWRDDTPVTTEELDRRLAAIKVELGPAPAVAQRARDQRFALVRLGDGQGVATALPLTGKATWLLSSVQGEPLRLAVQTKPTVIKLGEGVAGVEQPREMVLEIPDAQYTLAADDGKELHTGRMDMGTSNLELKVPGPGVYRFTCSRGGAGWEPQFAKGTACALLLGPGQDDVDIVDSPGAAKQSTIPAYFYVPKGTREIVFQAYQCGIVTVRDAGGEVAQQASSDGRFVAIPVADGMAGRAWSIELSDEARRGRLRFVNLATVLSFDPAQVFVPAEVAETDGLKVVAK